MRNSLFALRGSHPRVLIVGLFIAVAAVQVVSAAAEAPEPRCVHPYPCGDEWPKDLKGPFEPGPIEYVRVPVPEDHNDREKGTIELEGYIRRPILPDGVKAPIVLLSTQWLRLDALDGGDPGLEANEDLAQAEVPGVGPVPQFWSRSGNDRVRHILGVNPIEIVRNGFALAYFSARGSGGSGGCFDDNGSNSQMDQALLVEWLAHKDWSNERVGMIGVSAGSDKAIAAAVQQPPSLKTIVVSGITTDWYTWWHTPQGAFLTPALPTAAAFAPVAMYTPPIGREIGAAAPAYLEHACAEETPKGAIDGSGARGWQTNEKNEEYWEERSFLEGIDDIEAAVLLGHGFLDNLGHAFQESTMFDALNAPKRQVVGQWAHDFPNAQRNVTLDPSWELDQWEDLQFAWLDYWLKGIPPETTGGVDDLRLGTVDYQDSTKTWNESASWPPVEAPEEVLYLAGERMSPKPADGGQRFRSIPNLLNSYRGSQFVGFPYQPWGALCGDQESAPTSATYFTHTLPKEALIAGNPFAYLNIESHDFRGGIVAVAVADLGANFTCDAAGQPSDTRWITSGAADLRFYASHVDAYQGSLDGQDFETNKPTNIRIDLFDLAERIPAGHRLAVVVSYGETHSEWSGQPYFPEITIHAEGALTDSQVVFPIAKGSLGGKKPKIDYPPRPFVPESG